VEPKKINQGYPNKPKDQRKFANRSKPGVDSTGLAKSQDAARGQGM